MGFATFFVYLWVIENTANHVVVALHTFLEDVLKAWKHVFELGQKLIYKNQNFWPMQDSKQAVSRLSALMIVKKLQTMESNLSLLQQ